MNIEVDQIGPVISIGPTCSECHLALCDCAIETAREDGTDIEYYVLEPGQNCFGPAPKGKEWVVVLRNKECE